MEVGESFVLYVYQKVDGRLKHDAYGPSSDRSLLTQIGESMYDSEPGLAYMIVPLHPIPV